MFFLLVADLPLFHPAASCPRSAAHRPILTTKYMYKLFLSLIQILDWVKISKTRRILQKKKNSSREKTCIYGLQFFFSIYSLKHKILRAAPHQSLYSFLFCYMQVYDWVSFVFVPSRCLKNRVVPFIFHIKNYRKM